MFYDYYSEKLLLLLLQWVMRKHYVVLNSHSVPDDLLLTKKLTLMIVTLSWAVSEVDFFDE